MDKKIVIIQYVENEGPGMFADFFLNNERDMQIIDLSKGEKLPEDFENIAAVISLGGPMNVYEEDIYPFLKEVDNFIVRVLVEEIPFLGICLGAQLLAKACGAPVKKATQGEIGWFTVSLTSEGRRDPLFRDMPELVEVFQWHEDTFDIPKGGFLLAECNTCKNQAFRVGDKAYGLQFHIEVTPAMVETWMKAEKEKIDIKNILKDTRKIQKSFEKNANHLFSNFKQIIESSIRVKRVMKLFIEDEKKLKEKKCFLLWDIKEHIFIPIKR